MSKSQDAKKTVKKEPLKTAKEKKHQIIIGVQWRFFAFVDRFTFTSRII